jgi:DNA-binding CsgD family transcriptional regulator
VSFYLWWVGRKNIYTWLLYGAGLGVLAGMMAWVKYRMVVMDYALELYALFLGIVFVIVGAWLGSKLVKPKTIVREEVVIREVMVPVMVAEAGEQTARNQREVSVEALAASGISQRERDVLQLLAKGMSNEEIASGLFVSLNTVKTHLSNIYFKLDVKRRTQAVDKARVMGIIE